MSAEYEKTRIYAMEQALKNMVGMMQDSGADIRIAMSDFGDLDSHEFDDVIIDESIADKPFFDVDYNNAFRRSHATDQYVNYSEFSNYLNFPMKTGDNEVTAYTIANSKFNLANPSYTSHIGDDDKIVLTYSDIWGSDGVIRGKYFYYNTNQMPVKIDMTGSVEGTLRSDNVKTYYDTNEEAKLTYINYLGNSCTQSVDTPKYPWITYPDGSLVNDKYVEATDDPNEFVLTLEAYAQGEIRNLTKPADIVLVLDAVLAEYEVDAATTAADISAFLNKLHRLEIL